MVGFIAGVITIIILEIILGLWWLAKEIERDNDIHRD